MKKDMQTYKNKSNECNTIFHDTYILYKYNIGKDYHHIKNRDEERHMKEREKKIKKSEFNTRFLRHLPTIQVKYRYRLSSH